VLEPSGSINREGMMKRRDHGNPQQFPQEHPIAQTLVVVKDVEGVGLDQFQEFEEGPKAEGLNLREDSKPRGAELVEMKGRENLKGVYGGEEIFFLSEEVEIFNSVDSRPFKKQRPGGADDDMDFMAELHQFVAQIGQVDSLAPTVWISPVTQKSNLQTNLLKRTWQSAERTAQRGKR
jgi:hypothetical protein